MHSNKPDVYLVNDGMR